MEEHFSAAEGPADTEVLPEANPQVPFTQLPRSDGNCSVHFNASFQKIEGRVRTLHIGSMTTAQRGLIDMQFADGVQRSVSRAESHMEAEPPPSIGLQENCARIHCLFAEVIKELEDRIQDCGQLERFPQLEDYGRSRTYRRGKDLVCRLCREELPGTYRWHFETRHYDHFLDWLDRRARKEVRRRRLRLVRHLRERQNPN